LNNLINGIVLSGYLKVFFLTKEVSIFAGEGIYEAIIELGHSLLALEGLKKKLSHECAIKFLRKRYIKDFETEFLHKLRKIKHSIKYYGGFKLQKLLKNI